MSDTTNFNVFKQSTGVFTHEPRTEETDLRNFQGKITSNLLANIRAVNKCVSYRKMGVQTTLGKLRTMIKNQHNND